LKPKILRIKVRLLCRPVDWVFASYSPFTKSLVEELPDNAEKMRWCLIMHEPHVLSMRRRHMFQKPQ
jgi:hypothetical protein